jgi:hypothetical protein
LPGTVRKQKTRDCVKVSSRHYENMLTLIDALFARVSATARWVDSGVISTLETLDNARLSLLGERQDPAGPISSYVSVAAMMEDLSRPANKNTESGRADLLGKLLGFDSLPERLLAGSYLLSFETAVNNVHAYIQRAGRGWANKDTWNLADTIARRLAEQLDYLAANAHGWPGNDEYPTFESWQVALREAATNLRHVDPSPQAEQTLDAWYSLICEFGNTEETKAAFILHNEASERDSLALAAGWDWVSRNHTNLWD